jgi:hypothetical protein
MTCMRDSAARWLLAWWQRLRLDVKLSALLWCCCPCGAGGEKLYRGSLDEHVRAGARTGGDSGDAVRLGIERLVHGIVADCSGR